MVALVDGHFKDGDIKDIFNGAQGDIGTAQECTEALLGIYINLFDLNFTAVKRGSNFAGSFFVVVRNGDLVDIGVFVQRAYSNASHGASATQYDNMHENNNSF